MKLKILITIHLLVFASMANAQISLSECQQKARDNYPMVKQFGIIEQTAQYNISNANKAYLPQVSISAKASYQSDVTQIPESLEQILSQMSGRAVSFPGLSQDQYQAVIEATQLIYDGGAIRAQKEITKAATEIDQQKVEVELYALNERVNQVFFGILFIEEQLKQTEILKSELQTNYNKIESGIKNGVANQADLDVLKVEQLNVIQRETELKSTRKAYLLILGALIVQKLDEQTTLVKPDLDLSVLNKQGNLRPELMLFDAQNKLYDSQKMLINAGNMPRIGAFIQGGYGQPGLNMFADGFSPFYIGGLRLSWALSGFYSQKNNIAKLELGKNAVDVQRETFLFNTNMKVNQQKTEIEKLQSLMVNDEEIIQLRTRIKTAALAKVENGTLTSTDLVRELNAETQAKLSKSLHEIQLLMAIYNLKNTVNN
ncbi:MAG TPA: TolC family protein [Prolixibacteraceae bacterium]|nr:TolC family protein [Prolixibacteraceae bacterium]